MCQFGDLKMILEVGSWNFTDTEEVAEALEALSMCF
jgi:hypothetical protein